MVELFACEVAYNQSNIDGVVTQMVMAPKP